jgi:hypothetical protein
MRTSRTTRNSTNPDRTVLEAAIRNKYVDEPARKDNLYLWVGTHSRWKEWLVIGHAQPAHLGSMDSVPGAV